MQTPNDSLSRAGLTPVPGEQPQDQDSLDLAAYNAALRGQKDTGEAAPQSVPHPEQQKASSFFNRLIHGSDSGASRMGEMGREVMRGFSNVAQDGLTLAADAGTAVGIDSMDGLRHLVDTDEAWGAQSNDPIASTVGSILRFGSEFALTGGLGIEAGAARVGLGARSSALAANAARGAIVDFSQHDAREAQFAEMLATTRAPGIRQLGEALSVKGDDSMLEARLKRAAFGVVTGVALDVVSAGAKWVWARKALRSDPTNAAARTVLDEAESVLSGKAIPPDRWTDAVQVGEGQWQVRVLNEDFRKSLIEAGQKPNWITDVDHGVKAAGDGTLHFDPGTGEMFDAAGPGRRVPTADEFKTWREAIVERTRPVNEKEAAALAKAQADGLGHNGHQLPVDSPIFNNAGEAIVHANNINAAINERLLAVRTAGGLTEAGAKEFRARIGHLIRNIHHFDEDGVAAFFDGTAIDVSYHADPESLRTLALDLGTKMQEELAAVREAHGAVSNLETLRIYNSTIGGLTTEQMAGLAKLHAADGTRLDDGIMEFGYNTVIKHLGEKATAIFDQFKARPHDPVTLEEARAAAHGLLDFMKLVADEGTDWGFHGKMRQNAMEITKGIQGRPSTEVLGEPLRDIKPKAAADLSFEEIDGILTMAKLSGGEPRNLYQIVNGAKIIKKTKLIEKAVEWFINSVLSHPSTHGTALLGNAMASTQKAAGRVLGGVMTGNLQLAREGIDILVANERGFIDNIRAARAAFNQGMSRIDPKSSTRAIEGTKGEVIRTVGRSMLAIDEFTRITNYRSRVRAKSLRLWRQQGLSGAALHAQAEKDVAASFDSITGVAMDAEAMRYAEEPTLSSALTEGSLGQGVTDMVNSKPWLRFVAPFIKTGLNVFRWNFRRMPITREWYSTMTEGFKSGASQEAREAAQDLVGQTTLAASIWGYAALKFSSGEITGRGPSEPNARRMWAADHKPYTVKVGGRAVSFMRGDPVLTPLGIVADALTIIQELDEVGDRDGGLQQYEEVAAGAVAGLMSSFANKTFLANTFRFLEGTAGGDPAALQSWGQGLTQGMMVPGIVRAMNTDPVLREANNSVEAVMQVTPGLSKTLPAKYDLYGNVRMKTLSFLPIRDEGEWPEPQNTTDELLLLGKVFSPLPDNSILGFPADLKDKSLGETVDGRTAYERINDLIANPGNGMPPLKVALTRLVKSPAWQKLPAGTIEYPGGLRYDMAAQVIAMYRQQAQARVLGEKQFAKLREQMIANGVERDLAHYAGSAAVDEFLKFAEQ